MVERRRIDDELRVRIEDDQIRVEPHLDRSLRMLQTGKPRRCLAEPSRKAFDRHAARNGAGPHSGQTRTAATRCRPTPQEIAVVEVLERRRRTANDRWRRDRCAARERAPTGHRVPRSRIGGAHLNAVAPSGISSAAERQIVRAGLDGDRHARGARRGDRAERAGDARCTMCTRAPYSRARRNQQLDRRVLASAAAAVRARSRSARIGPRPARAASAAARRARAAAGPSRARTGSASRRSAR